MVIRLNFKSTLGPVDLYRDLAVLERQDELAKTVFAGKISTMALVEFKFIN